jgi:hypothetical protein
MTFYKIFILCLVLKEITADKMTISKIALFGGTGKLTDDDDDVIVVKFQI